MAREVARRFNQLYCGVDPHTEDVDYANRGGLFPIFKSLVGRVKRLVGTGGPNDQGELLKMSKSLNNAILLTDDPDALKQKIMGMYTDPNRIRSTDKGTVENNPLWIYHETFNPDHAWVLEAEERYRQGQIGDVECKRRLIEVLEAVIEPIRQRRLALEKDPQYVMDVLRKGSEKANIIAQDTWQKSKNRDAPKLLVMMVRERV